MKRTASIVVAFLVFLLASPVTVAWAAPDHSNPHQDQLIADPTPVPSPLPPSPSQSPTPQPSISPSPTAAPTTAPTPEPTATPQPPDNSSSDSNNQITITIPDSSEGVGGTVNLHLDEPAPSDSPTPSPTATPKPKRKVQTVAAVKSPPQDPPISQPKKDPISQIIAPSTNFVGRSIPKEFYQSESLSRGETAFLIIISAISLIVGLVLINEKYFAVLLSWVRSSLPNRKTNPSFS